jgi:hypothetical protein
MPQRFEGAEKQARYQVLNMWFWDLVVMSMKIMVTLFVNMSEKDRFSGENSIIEHCSIIL